MEEEIKDEYDSEEEESFEGGVQGESGVQAEVTEIREVDAPAKPSPKRQQGQQQLGELHPKKVVEAALFISSKPLPLEVLGRFVGVAAPGFVESLIKELSDDYDRNGSAIKVSLEPEGYILRLRSEYARRVAPLAQEAEISKGALKILAYISQNEGIEQSRLARRLGSTVYDYIRELVEKGFLDKQKKGRTSVLSTTQKFRDYFNG